VIRLLFNINACLDRLFPWVFLALCKMMKCFVSGLKCKRPYISSQCALKDIADDIAQKEIKFVLSVIF